MTNGLQHHQKLLSFYFCLTKGVSYSNTWSLLCLLIKFLIGGILFYLIFNGVFLTSTLLIPSISVPDFRQMESYSMIVVTFQGTLKHDNERENSVQGYRGCVYDLCQL